jgi:phosphoribosylglycinamide formyltransferase 1
MVKRIKNIAVFISGKGTNAKNIISYYHNSTKIKVKFVFSTKENDDVAKFCEQYGLAFFIEKEQSKQSEKQQKLCFEQQVDWVILAGYLKQIGPELISYLSERIINLHPALLPKFGGKGMHGKNVHNAVIAAKETKSGITIHRVNEVFDEGEILLQYECSVDRNETAESLEEKIHILERNHFPEAISRIIQGESGY